MVRIIIRPPRVRVIVVPKGRRPAKRETPAAASGTSSRIPALDFTKGVLVGFMVLYHWLNYFVGAESNVYRYLRFLTPSFIFITGFLISHVHANKYGAANPKLSARLFWRGLKIIAVFVGLNVLIGLLFPDYSVRNIFAGHSLLSSLKDVFVSGNALYGARKTTAFTILVPIGYLLVVSAGLARLKWNGFYVAGTAVLLCTIFLALGVQSVNLELVMIGLLGVMSGHIPNVLTTIREHPLLIALSYGAYIAAITILDVSLPLRVIGVCLSLMLIYVIGAAGGDTGRFQRWLLVLGKYSLFAYVSQIAILQLLHRGLAHSNLGVGGLVASLLAAFALTIISAEVVDLARPKSKVVDKFYKAVFA